MAPQDQRRAHTSSGLHLSTKEGFSGMRGESGGCWVEKKNFGNDDVCPRLVVLLKHIAPCLPTFKVALADTSFCRDARALLQACASYASGCTVVPDRHSFTKLFLCFVKTNPCAKSPPTKMMKNNSHIGNNAHETSSLCLSLLDTIVLWSIKQ